MWRNFKLFHFLWRLVLRQQQSILSSLINYVFPFVIYSTICWDGNILRCFVTWSSTPFVEYSLELHRPIDVFVVCSKKYFIQRKIFLLQLVPCHPFDPLLDLLRLQFLWSFLKNFSRYRLTYLADCLAAAKSRPKSVKFCKMNGKHNLTAHTNSQTCWTYQCVSYEFSMNSSS